MIPLPLSLCYAPLERLAIGDDLIRQWAGTRLKLCVSDILRLTASLMKISLVEATEKQYLPLLKGRYHYLSPIGI
jgi:hypothetical protein